jgi:hypothetical protein
VAGPAQPRPMLFRNSQIGKMLELFDDTDEKPTSQDSSAVDEWLGDCASGIRLFEVWF